MTVQQLIEVLKNTDPNKEVCVHNEEWDSYDPLDYVEVNKDGDVTVYCR
jgi:hypothetical protein